MSHLLVLFASLVLITSTTIPYHSTNVVRASAQLPCRLQFNVFAPNSHPSELPSEVFPVSTTPPEIIENLLAYAERGINGHYDAISGYFNNDIRGTVIAAILFAERGDFLRSEQAIKSVLKTQDLREGSLSYGNFPLVVDGDYSDRNASAFVGSYLLVYLDRYSRLISYDLSQQIADAIFTAAIHRTCTPHFLNDNTNIVILSSFLMLRAGERLGNQDIFLAGRLLWDQFVLFTLNHGIAEYNSPNYARISLHGLSFIVDYVQDPVVVAQAVRIRQLFWWSITQHYHSPTSQIAGPFSRTFTDRMLYEPTNIQPLMYRESLGRIPIFHGYPMGNTDSALAVNAVLPAILSRGWPDDWVDIALAPPVSPRQYVERVEELGLGAFKQTTTYLDQWMALGSVNVEAIYSLNEQRRPIIAHAVHPITSEVGVFYAYSSLPEQRPILKCVQNYRSILCLIWIGNYQQGGLAEDKHTLVLRWLGKDTAGEEATRSLEKSRLFRVNWIDIPVQVIIMPIDGDVVVLTTELADGFEIRLDAILPETRPESASLAYVPFVFGLAFGEFKNQTGQLNPIRYGLDSSRSMFEALWNSPDGVLSLNTLLSPLDRWWYQVSAINGIAVNAVPLQIDP